MNAVSNSRTNFIEDNGSGGSDTDTNLGESPEYYEPITAGENYEDNSFDQNSDDYHEPTFHALPNGYAHCIENGVSSLDLSSDKDEEEEEERIREASNSAIRSAYVSYESRRNARLPPENAVRVMEAKRGISFGGFLPYWASWISEDQWLNQHRRIRRPPPPSSTPPVHD